MTSGLVYGTQFVPLSLWLQTNTPGNVTNETWVPDECRAVMANPEILAGINTCAVLPTLLDTNMTSTDQALRFIFSQCVLSFRCAILLLRHLSQPQLLSLMWCRYVGIFGMSLLSVIVYLIVTCNKPQELPTRAFGPSLLSGVVWALGTIDCRFASAFVIASTSSLQTHHSL